MSRSFQKQESFKRVSFSPRNNENQENGTQRNSVDYAPPSILQQQVSTLERLMTHESWLDLNPSEPETPATPADDDNESVRSLKEELDGVFTLFPDMQRELAQLELELGLSSPKEETLQRNQDDADEGNDVSSRRELHQDLVASPSVNHRILRKPRIRSSESLDSLASPDTAPKSVLLLRRKNGELDDQGALSDSASTTEDSVDKDPPNIIDEQDAVPTLPQDVSFMGKWKNPTSMLFASSAIMVASLVFGEPKSNALNLVSFRYC
jgi:hypothetical protein